MTEALFAADRGYKSHGSTDFLNYCLDAPGLGTYKRWLDYPFVFDDGPIAKRHKGMRVSEKGSRVVYIANRKPSGVSGRLVQASLYRENFSGRIAAIYHNNIREISAQKFAIKPKSKFRQFSRFQIGILKGCFRSCFARPLSRYLAYTKPQNWQSNVPRMRAYQIITNVNHLTIMPCEDLGWFRSWLVPHTSVYVFFKNILKFHSGSC